MTSREIQALNGFDRSEKDWLKEIAYQLAVMNERDNVEIVQEAPAIDLVQPRRGPGRPKKVA